MNASDRINIIVRGEKAFRDSLAYQLEEERAYCEAGDHQLDLGGHCQRCPYWYDYENCVVDHE